MVASPSPPQTSTPARRAGLRRDALLLLAGIGLGAVTLFATQPARADMITVDHIHQSE